MTDAATFRATIKPHPLRAGVVDDRVAVGCTLADMGAGGAVLAFVDGARADELGYVPQADQHVVLIATAEGGGGGKDPLRLAATLALAFAAPGIGAGIAGAGASAGAAAGWGLAVNLAGNLAINALIPPSTQALDRFDPLKPFEGLPNASNALQPFGVIPRLYGTHRVFPPQASRPFSESEGSDQYLRMLLCLGYGPLEIDDLAPGLHRAPDEGGTSTVPSTVRIGETALNEYTDWELEWLPGGDSDPPLTLFTRNVIETAPEAPVFDDEGITATRTAAAGKTISVDLAAPAIVQLGRQAYPCAVGIRVEVRATGTGGAWLEVTPPEAASPGDVPGRVSGNWRQAYSGNFPAFDGVTGATGNNVLFPAFDTLPAPGERERAWFLKGSEIKPVSLSVEIDLPTNAAYDVRITRLKTWSVQDPRFGPVAPREPFQADFAWRALRTIGADIAQTVAPGLAFLALRIRTTDQLNGVVNNLSVVAHAPLPTWNGSAWVTARTSNPAYIYRDVLTGAANGRPLDAARVDDDAIIDWAARNDTADREFNGIFDGRTTVYEAARNVASTGRAAFSIRDGLFSVVEDMPSKVPRQLFTPRNCWDFGATKTFSRPLHALKVKFKNRDADWQDSERIVYADGYSEDGSGGTQVATEFESLALFGLTDKQQAFVEGRYFQAVAVLRPETATWMADIENLVCRRGDVVRYQHDAMLLGLGAGRIKATTVGSITLDEPLTVEVGKTYQVRIRKSDGTQALATVTNGVGTHKTLTLNGGLPAGVLVGDLVAFGETGLVTQDWLITGMEPQADFQARITAVPYSSPQVFDTGPIPPYDPLVTRPETRPPEPVIVNVLSGAGAALRANNGGRTPRILVSYVFPSSSVAVPQVEAALLRDGDRSWEMRPWQPNSGLYTFVIADAAADYRVRIRGVADDGTPGPWAEAVAASNETVLGELLSITLIEQPNTPSTPNGDLSTVVATVLPPEDVEDYAYSIVEYRRAGEAAWQEGGTTGPDNKARVVLPADGAEWQFRARMVSSFGVADDDGPIESITLSRAGVAVPDPDAGSTPDAALNVANLRLEGQLAAVNTFTGPDCSLVWNTLAAAQDYRVRIFSVWGSPVLLRTVYVPAPAYRYTYALNALDSAAQGLDGPQREFLVEVVARSRDGRISATAATKQPVNPPPTLPLDFTATAFFSAIEMQYGAPADGDYAGVRVHMSTAPGFTAGPANVVYDGGPEMPIIVQGLEAGTTYYYRLVLRDLFGPGPASDEFESTTQGLPWEDNVPPTVPTGLTLRSEVQEADLYTSAALIAEWEAATDNSGRLFYEIEYWTDEAEVAADTRSGNEEEAFVLAMFDGSDTVAVGLEEGAVAGGIFRDATVATSYTVFPARVGATYYFRVRAVDYSGNRSDWSGLRQHTIVGDTVPPAVPTGLTLTGGLDKAVLRWTNPPDTDWLQTRVHRGTSGLFTAGPQNLIAETRGSVYVDTPLVPGINYWYRLVAVDSSGNASAATAATGPVQAIRIDPVNVADFLAPDTIDPARLTQGFRDRLDGFDSGIADIDDQLGIIDTTLDGLQTQVTGQGGLIAGLDDAVDTLSDASAAQAGQITGLQDALVDAQGDITDINGLIAGLDDSVDDLQAAQAAQAATIGAIQSELSELLNTPEFDAGNDYLIDDAVVSDGKLYRAIVNQTAPSVAPPDTDYWQLIGDFASLGEAVAGNSAAISLLQSEVTEQDGRITSNATAITGVISDVTALETEQTAQGSAISTLQTTTTQQGNDIASNADAITAVESDVTALQSGVAGNASAISGLSTTVATQGSAITSNAAAITAVSAGLDAAEQDIAANADTISGLETTVSSQGGQITANANAITSLQSDLQDAESGVAANASAISGLNATVTTQGGQIASNSTAITALQSGLSTAEGNISANAGAIGALQTEVTDQDGRITANATDITQLQADVTDVEAGVAANATAISETQVEVAQQGEDIEAAAFELSLLTADLTAPYFALGADGGAVLALSDESGPAVAVGVRTATATAINDLRVEVSLQGDQLVSTAQQITGLEADIDVLGGQITGNATAIDGLQTTVVQQGSDIAANSTAITGLEAGLTTAQGDISANATAIGSLDATVSSQGSLITANSNAITNLQSDLQDAESGVAANASAISGLSTTVTTQGGQIASNAGAITALQSDVADVETGVAGNATAITALETEVTSQDGRITSNATDITQLQTDVTAVEGEAAANATAISGLQATTTTQAGLIAANAADITALEADVSSLETGQSGQATAISALQAEVISQGDDITANASDITGLRADLTDAEGNIAVSAAAISALETTTTQQGTDIAANASSITALQVGLTAAQGDITANAGAINTLEAEVLDQDGRITANAADITGLTAVVEDPVTGVAANADAISGLQTTVTQQGEDIEATAGDVTEILADLTVPTFALGADGGAVLAFSDESGPAVAVGARLATSRAIESLQVTVALQGDQLISTAAQITALESGIDVLGGTVAGNSAAISGLMTTVTQQGNDITSNAAAITAVEAEISLLQGDVTGNASAISGLSATVSAQGGMITANASAITALSTEVDGNSASITSALASIDGIEAQFSVRANVNGRITGFGLIAGGAETTFGILADRFVVVDPADDATAQAPFEIVGGAVYIRSAFVRALDAAVITAGELDAGRIGAASITADKLDVDELSAISADLGSVTAGTVTGALIRTAASGARVELSTPNGIRAINASAVTTAQISPNGSGFFGAGGSAISWDAAGVVTVPGTLLAGDIVGNTFRTATSGWRVEVGPSLTGSTVLRYTNGTTTRLSLSQTGDLTLTGAITGSTITGGLIRTSAGATRVEIDGSNNSVEYFESGVSQVLISSQAYSIPGFGTKSSLSRFGALSNADTSIYCISVGTQTSIFRNEAPSGASAIYATTTGSTCFGVLGDVFGTNSEGVFGVASGTNSRGVKGQAANVTGGVGGAFQGGFMDVQCLNTHIGSGGHLEYRVATTGAGHTGRPTWVAPEGTTVCRRQVIGGPAFLWLQQGPGTTSNWVGFSTF